jgi:hypothetical protein
MSDHFGFHLGLVQRSKGGSALVHSAYQRGGAARRLGGSLADFSHRTDVVASFVVRPKGTPAWAADPIQLWTKAVAAEKRADAQEARLLELSIPRALPRKHWGELARHVANALARHGMVVQVDIHCPRASDGKINPHAHFMATMREIVNGEFSRKKARHWNRIFHRGAKALRHKMAEILNEFCRRKGVEYHADPRSNAERGLPPAEVRLERWNILHFKRTGKKTPAIARRDDERAVKAQIARLQEEGRKLERELEAARADAGLTAPEHVRPIASPKMAPISTDAVKSAKRSSPPAKSGKAIISHVSTNSDLPGPRYGP